MNHYRYLISLEFQPFFSSYKKYLYILLNMATGPFANPQKSKHQKPLSSTFF
jgi:hypothetical protein